MKTKRAYKIFFKNGDDDLKSYAFNSLKGPYKLIYDKCKVNYPKVTGSKLFVFDSLHSAKLIKSRITYCDEIWEVEIPENSARAKFRVNLLSEEDMNSFWKSRAAHKKLKNVFVVPVGTILADSVKLIRKVSDEELKEEGFEII